MATGKLIRAATFAALLASTSLVPAVPVVAEEPHAADTADVATTGNVPVIKIAASEATSRFIPLGIGKSVAIDLPEDIKDVLVADPKIANAVIRSSRRVYMIGATVGQTNIFFFDAKGKQIAGFDIAVTRDLNGLRAALKRAMPGAHLQVQGVGDGVMLTGTVSSGAEAQQAFDLASRLTGDTTKVVNGIVVRERDQVLLKVTVAEVQRDVVKQLGVNLSGSFGFVREGVINFNTDNPFSASGQPLSNTATSGQQGITTDPITGALSPRIKATVRAMEQAGVIRTLAEPNLTAISGETANFLVGGEFPYVSNVNPSTGQPQIDFKKFGVSLIFTPVVLSEGRISLKVYTEVSELSSEGAISQGGFSIPSLKVRRAETTVEVPSGGSLAMAGMLKQQSKQAINGLPGLMQLPILGTLFKSRDYINNQTELMILVTPYVVRAVAQKKLSKPDDGLAEPNDPQGAFLGKLNRIYGRELRVDAKHGYRGKYGFILD
jgi:pilus assembly protein CpaC